MTKDSKVVRFWSSVELGAFHRGVCDNLQRRNWSVENRYVVADRSYRKGGPALQRIKLRGLAYCVYPAWLVLSGASKNIGGLDVVSSNTFYGPACALLSKRQGCRRPVVNWVLDLFPEVLESFGPKLGRRPLRYLARATMKFTFRRASANIFLGSRLLSYAEEIYGKIPNSHVIPIGADVSLFSRSEIDSRKERRGSGCISLLYCGNLGKLHDSGTWMEAIDKVGIPENLRFEFRGSGSGMEGLSNWLRRTHNGSRVLIGGPLGDKDWREKMVFADIALVSLKSGAERIAMPSKCYSALAAGQPLLAVCSRESDLADLVINHDAGWVVEVGDSTRMGMVLKEIAARPELITQKGRNAREAAERIYASEKVGAVWDSVLGAI